MRNERFRQGHYSTKFIELEYAEGFKGVQLRKEETFELVATACAVQHSQGMQSMSDEEFDTMQQGDNADELVICLDDPSNPDALQRAFACHVSAEDSLVVIVQELDAAGEALGATASVAVSSLDWVNETPLLAVEFNDEGKETQVQYSGRTAEGFNLQFRGATARVSVRSGLEHELYVYLPLSHSPYYVHCEPPPFPSWHTD